jgi:membrane fusion protein (multidrug efflux system)
MFADARLLLGSEEGLAVADDAIISEGLSTYVFTVVDGTARRTAIETGASLEELTEVRSGLAPGDRVVVAGWDRLSDGAPVEVADDIAREGLQ